MSLSLFAEDSNRLDVRGAIGRNDGGEDADDQEKKSDRGKSERVGGADAINQGPNDAAERQSGGEAERDTQEDWLQPIGKDHSNDVPARSAKGNANADFADTAANGVRKHAVNADGSKNQGEPREAGEEQHIETLRRDGLRNHVVHAHHLNDGKIRAHLMNSGGDRRNGIRGIGIGSHRKVHTEGAPGLARRNGDLSKRMVDGRHRAGLIKRIKLNVAHNADDLANDIWEKSER